MKNLERTIKSLANLRRLKIVKFLAKDGNASVSEIASEIRLSFKATSKHLSILASAGILDKEQKSINVIYFLHKQPPQVAKKIIALLSNSRE